MSEGTSELSTPQFSSERGIIGILMPDLLEITDGIEPIIQPISLSREVVNDESIDAGFKLFHPEAKKWEYSRAFRIIFPWADIEECVAAVLLDRDDCSVPYTLPKANFHNGLANVFDEADPILLQTSLNLLNKSARVRPMTAISPERYSPFFNLFALTMLKNSPDILQTVFNQVKNEAEMRLFLRESIVKDKLPNDIEPFELSGKIYFREIHPQAMARSLKSCPVGIDPNIFSPFYQNLVLSPLKAEISKFDLPDNVYEITSTAGEDYFQLIKQINDCKVRKQHGIRLPSEIIIYSRGRKGPPIAQIIE